MHYLVYQCGGPVVRRMHDEEVAAVLRQRPVCLDQVELLPNRSQRAGVLHLGIDLGHHLGWCVTRQVGGTEPLGQQRHFCGLLQARRFKGDDSVADRFEHTKRCRQGSFFHVLLLGLCRYRGACLAGGPAPRSSVTFMLRIAVFALGNGPAPRSRVQPDSGSSKKA